MPLCRRQNCVWNVRDVAFVVAWDEDTLGTRLDCELHALGQGIHLEQHALHAHLAEDHCAIEHRLTKHRGDKGDEECDSGLGTFLGLAHAAITAEGDNSVLMQKVAKEKAPFEREVLAKDAAIDLFKSLGQDYKLQLIEAKATGL